MSLTPDEKVEKYAKVAGSMISTFACVYLLIYFYGPQQVVVVPNGTNTGVIVQQNEADQETAYRQSFVAWTTKCNGALDDFNKEMLSHDGDAPAMARPISALTATLEEVQSQERATLAPAKFSGVDSQLSDALLKIQLAANNFQLSPPQSIADIKTGVDIYNDAKSRFAAIPQ